MLATGTHLGPYRIHSLLGAGGMGEVYRATDDRIGRDVAVKVLPRALATDAELLQRFEQEARAAGQLSHPNVLVIYDVGLEDGTPYMVTELLEGETLRGRLDEGPLPARRVVEIAEQIAAGLAAAHARGIVHRDLKPENLFVTGDGHVKILDFGIAKLTRGEGGVAPAEDTRTVPASLTATGAIIGTASYMAPEQIRGRPTDHRADLFALGAILYELLTGRKAFEGETAADRMSAILTAEPPALSAEAEGAVPGFGTLIRRCLEKRPEARFDTARDLAFTLRVLLEAAQGGRGAAGDGSAAGETVEIRRLTFREGTIDRSRFGPDGQTVVFSCSWEGEPSELYMTRVGSPETRPVGLGAASLLDISSAGEMAVALRPRDVGGFVRLGVLARVPLIGGAPRELLNDVSAASWGPDGRALAVIREVDGGFRLEYPIGTAIARSGAWISYPRVSPDGRRVAYLSHHARGDNAGDVMEVDLSTGATRTVIAGFAEVYGLIYGHDGEELWFSGSRTGAVYGMYGVDRGGRLRALHAMAGNTDLQDRSASGSVLLHNATPRMRMEVRSRDDVESRELSWLEWSLVRDVSPDGTLALFDETSLGGGPHNSIYVRPTAGGPAVRLGDGIAARFSEDGTQVLAIDRKSGDHVAILPVGVGESIPIQMRGHNVHWGCWIPGTDQLCVVTDTGDGRLRPYRVEIATGAVHAVPCDGLKPAVSYCTPDGSALLAMDLSGRYALHPWDGGTPRRLEWIAPMERPVRFSEDGAHVYLFERDKNPAPITRVEVLTGKREPWFAIGSRQRSGAHGLNSVSGSPDGAVFVYSYVQRLSVLYVADGFR